MKLTEMLLTSRPFGGPLPILVFLLLILLIRWTYSSLKKEKEGHLQITQAAQELNNKTLHDAGTKLFESTNLKFLVFWVTAALAAGSIIISLLIN